MRRATSLRVGGAAREHLLALSETRENCFSGTADIAVNDAEGIVKTTVHAAELDATGVPTALDLSLEMSAYGIAGLGTLNGRARLWSAPIAGGGRTLLRYSSTLAVLPRRTVRLDFDLDQRFVGTRLGTRINGALSLRDQAHELVQVSDFSSTLTGHPDSGLLRVSDARGDHVDIAARGALVDRDFYLAGASTPASGVHSTPWTDFEGP